MASAGTTLLGSAFFEKPKESFIAPLRTLWALLWTPFSHHSELQNIILSFKSLHADPVMLEPPAPVSQPEASAGPRRGWSQVQPALLKGHATEPSLRHSSKQAAPHARLSTGGTTSLWRLRSFGMKVVVAHLLPARQLALPLRQVLATILDLRVNLGQRNVLRSSPNLISNSL